MKKLLTLLLVFVLVLSLGLFSCNNNETPDDNDDETTDDNTDDEVRVLSHGDFLAAEVGSKVTIEAYVQATQSWWNNSITIYLQDNVGGYFAYNIACTEENAAKLVPGTKIRVTGEKKNFNGEIEVADGTFEFCDAADTFIAKPFDATSILASDTLINHMNKFVTFKGLTVVESNKKDDTTDYAFLYNWDGSGEQGSDLYFNVTDGTKVYNMCVESYLCGKDTDVYKAVEALEIGDVIDLRGFLYWYEGVNPHITHVSPSKSEGALNYFEYMDAAVESRVTIEAYVQATQGWWNNSIVIYLQDEVGGYFAYGIECTEENAAKLVPGTKIKVTGEKAVFNGEVEVMNGTFEFCDTEETFIADALDATALLGTDKLINHMNKFVTFKGLTVVKSNKKDDTTDYAFLYNWDGSGEQGSDLYFNVTDGTNVYNMCVESYLCGKDTDVYKAVEALEIGDKIDIEAFLYWYEGVNPHVVSVAPAEAPQQ